MNKTRVVRSWSSTLVRLLGGLGCIAVSAVMFDTMVEGAITAGLALIPGILGIVFVWSAISGSATSTCPGCGARLDSLSTGSNDGVCCRACHNYVEGKQGELWMTDPQRVADAPLFATHVGAQLSWPDGCCVCAQPATRSIAITAIRAASASNAGVAIATGGAVVASNRTKFTLEVPHCAQHDNGAHPQRRRQRQGDADRVPLVSVPAIVLRAKRQPAGITRRLVGRCDRASGRAADRVGPARARRLGSFHSLGASLARRIPGAARTVDDDGGGSILWTHGTEILEALLEARRRAST